MVLSRSSRQLSRLTGQVISILASKLLHLAAGQQVGGLYMLIDRPKGDFAFLSAASLSLGCRAQPGFEIIHATFRPLPALLRGYDLVERHLRNIGRPIEALCGMELRMPQPSLPGPFAEFNKRYADKLASWGLFMNTVLPTTRTNVALEVHPVEEPSLFGFYYTQPAKHDRRTFVLSGV